MYPYRLLFRNLMYSTTTFHDTHNHNQKKDQTRGHWMTMYRTSSPSLFDIPDFPTLRRVKPLPKRRRTSLNIHVGDGVNDPSQQQQQVYINSTTAAYHSRMPLPPPPPPLPPFPPPPGRDPKAAHFRAQAQAIVNAADTLSSSIDAVFHTHSERRIPPDIYNHFPDIPADILRVATVFPEKTPPRVDSDGDGEESGEMEALSSPSSPQLVGNHHRQHQHQHQRVATPPPPSNESTEDEEDSSEQTPPLPPTAHPSQFRPSFMQPQHNGNAKNISNNNSNVNTNKEPNGDDALDLGGTEDDLQERLFLRAETDRLLAHADSLSARMALQSYYRSMGYGTPEFTTSNINVPPVPLSASGALDGLPASKEYIIRPPLPLSQPPPPPPPPSSGHLTTATSNGYIAVGVGRGQQMDEGGDPDGRGDYADHSSQQGQGNTKKRKVPANVGSSPPHHYQHHSYYYPPYHRGAVAAAGIGGGLKEDDDRSGGGEFSFGLGFGLEGDSGGGSGRGEDVFGPVPDQVATGEYPHHPSLSASEEQLAPQQYHRKAKLTTMTLAGLQRKELIRSRKKQLESIMGTLPAAGGGGGGGDSWALDYALSANFPPLLSSFSSSSTGRPSSPSNSPVSDSDHPAAFGGVRGGGRGNWEVGWGWGEGEKEVKMRMSRRYKMRVARGARIGLERLGRHPDAAPFPVGKFEFAFSSAITERSVAIQEEVASLRTLFGAELAKRTAKAAKMVAARNGSGKGTGGHSGKTGGKKRVQQRAKTSANANAVAAAKSGDQQAEFLEMPPLKGADVPAPQQQQLSVPQGDHNQSTNRPQTPTPTPTKKGKKKKRSTLANASNPHHLRNYVPSRLPHAVGGVGSVGGAHGQTNQGGGIGLFWPVALRFLSAQLPPRRRKGASGGGENGVTIQQQQQQLVVPQDEWICSFCEHNLFYGDDVEYRRAVRNRKKILRRRRRARERAAAAASGVNAAMRSVSGGLAEKTQIEDEEYDGPGYESVPANDVNSARVDGSGRLRTREAPG